jgi:hypothetical protein
MWNALNSFLGLSAIEELNVCIQPSDIFVLIGNQHFSLWVTSSTELLHVGWFIQNPILWQRSLVASALRVTSFCVTSFYQSVGNLTPTLVQNFIFNSMDLLMRISFQDIFDHRRGKVVANFLFLDWLLHIDLLEQVLVRVSNSSYVTPIIMVHRLLDIYDCMSISC